MALIKNKVLFLLGGSINGNNYLLAWKSELPEHIEFVPVGGYISFGSGKEILDDTLLKLLRNWHKSELKDLMVILSSGLQVSAQHQNSISSGVGGMFTVAALNEGLVQWMDDVNFITYAPSNFVLDKSFNATLNVVSSFIRDGWQILCTRSPGLKKLVSEEKSDKKHSPLKVKILATILNYRKELWDKYESEIDELTDKLSSHYYVFLSRKEPRAVVVQAHNKMMAGKMVQGTVKHEKLTLVMKPEFLDYLLPEKVIGTEQAPAIVLILK